MEMPVHTEVKTRGTRDAGIQHHYGLQQAYGTTAHVKLYWSDLNHDFFDMSLYAGEGNIGHMIEQVNMCKYKILND